MSVQETQWTADSSSKGAISLDVLAEGRGKCYTARDAFFACLDQQQGQEVPTEIGRAGLLYPRTCKDARRKYEAACRSTWVHHFDRAYGAKRRVERLLK